MIKCYLNKSKGYVDLYMNDLYALKETLKVFFNYHNLSSEEDIEEDKLMVCPYN